MSSYLRLGEVLIDTVTTEFGAPLRDWLWDSLFGAIEVAFVHELVDSLGDPLDQTFRASLWSPLYDELDERFGYVE